MFEDMDKKTMKALVIARMKVKLEEERKVIKARTSKTPIMLGSSYYNS